MKRRWKLLALGMYSLVMFWLLFGQRIGQSGQGNLQLEPLRTIRLYLRVLAGYTDTALRQQAWSNLAGNVFLFVPLGFFLPWIWEKWRRFWPHFLLMTAIILSVELTQLAADLGWCDVDDLILNLLGTAGGFLLWRLLHQWTHKRRA